jgi:oligopeptidase A
MNIIETKVRPGGSTAVLLIIDWENFHIEGIAEEFRKLCDEGRVLADRIAVLPSPGFAELVVSFEELTDRMHQVEAPLGHLGGVSPDAYPGIRDAKEELALLAAAYGTDIGQHEGLFTAFKHFRASGDYSLLASDEQKIIDDTLRDFTLAGVGLSPEAKARLKAIQEEASTQGNLFNNNLIDVQKEWSLHVTDVDRLAGVPSAIIAAMAGDAKAREVEGWLVTLRQDVAMGIMSHAKDRKLREEVYIAWTTRASDQGPLAGKYDNAPVALRLLALGHEEAKLLGFGSYAELALEKRMVPSVSTVNTFLETLASRAHEKAGEEFAELSQFAADELSIAKLEGWDISFAAEALKKKRYDYDPEEVRKYFPAAKVFEGMFTVVKDCYGISALRRDDIRGYHSDVVFYEILDESGLVIGGCWVDLFSRSDKKSGAWMDIAAFRRETNDGLQLPVGLLTCNFTKPEKEGEEAYLTFDEILTTYHEFGHNLHHLVCKSRYIGTSMNGVEWDAIELPSQFMENFAKDIATLREFSSHKETGEAIPEELALRLIASEEFQMGLFLTRQLLLGTFDWEIYRDYDPAHPPVLHEKWRAVQERISVTPMYPWQRPANNFGHIFAGGYSAGYYSYLWAQALGADAWEAFKETGKLRNPEVGRRFLRAVLEEGASSPMEQLYRNFRGRDADPEALLRYYSLIAE